MTSDVKLAPLDGELLDPEPNWFRLGGIVTRDGTDEQEVIAIWPDNDPLDQIQLTLRCLKAPQSGWCKIGEEETNLPGSYSLVRRPARLGR